MAGGSLPGEVVHHQFVATLLHVGRHAGAHRADPDKANFHFCFLLDGGQTSQCSSTAKRADAVASITAAAHSRSTRLSYQVCVIVPTVTGKCGMVLFGAAPCSRTKYCTGRGSGAIVSGQISIRLNLPRF